MDATMPKVCDGCGAVGVSCCATAKARRDTADSLARLVARQSAAITQLTRERDEARQALADVRRTA